MDKITIKIAEIKKITAKIKPIVLPVEGGYNQGYNDGYEVGKLDGEKDGFNKGYEDGFTDGQESVPNVLEYASKLETLYQNVVFPSEYELTLSVQKPSTIRYLVYTTSGLKKITLKIADKESSVICRGAFRMSSDLEEIDLTDFNVIISDGWYMFAQSRKLREIKGELDFTGCTDITHIFYEIPTLEEVRIKPNTLSLSINLTEATNNAPSKLSAASKQSIIDGLAYVDTPQTITFHSSIVLTDDQKATISSKGWTLAQ